MATETIKENTQKAEDRKALEYFRERFQAMDSARLEYYNNFEKDEKLFRSHLETATKADWQSKYFIPRTYGLVMASLSEFAINKPDIIIEPDTRQDALRVSYLKAVMHANWRKNKGNAELLFGLLDALKLGIGIFEIGYRKEERTVKSIKDYDPATEDVDWEKKKIFDFDDVYFETVNPRYFWLEESAATISDANDCVRKYIFSEETFHRKFDSKYEKAKDVKVKGQVIKDEFFKPFIGTGTGTNEICVYKYQNKSKDVMWWIANGVLLNEPDDPIPFHHKQLPYAELKLAPYDRYTFYGLSLPRIVEDLQHEINTLRNMKVDQTHLNIFSPFFYSAEEDLDETIFTIEPGVGIPVSDPGAFKFFKQGDVGPDAYKMEEAFDQDIRQATGFDLRLQGLRGGGTATETSILKETSLKRINLYLRFMEELCMPDFAELWKDAIQQFYFTSSETKKRKTKKRVRVKPEKGKVRFKIREQEEVFRSIKIPKADIINFRGVDTVEGFNFLYVTEDKIRGKFGANVKIGTTISISKELDKQVKLQLYSIFARETLVKRYKLVQDVLKSHDRDPEEYMELTPEINISESIALAEEQNKQIMAGEEPPIVTELITPEHIQLHDVLLKSDTLDRKAKNQLRKHVLDEIRLSRVSGLMGRPAGAPERGMEFTALEREPQLTKRIVKQPGLTREAVLPGTAAEVGPTIMRPAPKPRE